MKKVFLLILLAVMTGFETFAQNTVFDTVTKVYTFGDIGTSRSFRYDGDTSPCPGYMNIPVPNNAIVYTVDVAYSMTAVSPQRKSDQRSQLWCTSPGGKKESTVFKGSGYTPGTMDYQRTGLDIAFGVKPVFDLGVDFQLHAGTINYYAGDTCSTINNKVDDSTWTVKVIYLPPGSPDFASNPTPGDEAQLVSLTPTLTWDFGENTVKYDLYMGTDNPPTTKVVSDMTANGTSGSYTVPDSLLESTVYYWKVVGKNNINENPGVVWSFKTKCGTPVYPYKENFDGVTAPALPDCWIPTTNDENNTIKTFSSYNNSHSSPNYVKFSAESNLLPQMVLVLPKVENVKDMVLSLWGKNPTNWTTGDPYSFPFEIGTVTDPFDYSTFTSYASFVPGGDYTYKEVYFNNYTGTDEYIAIRAAVPQYGYLYLDDVTLDLIPNCVKPLDLVLDSVTTSTATISWTDLISSPGKWEIEYDTLGAEFGSGTRVEVTTNPATITGLADGAYYNVYARSICGVGDTSVWSLPLTILTECLPKELPLAEDFGEIPPYPEEPELPVCWSLIDQNSNPNGGIFLSTYDTHTGVGLVFSPEEDTNAQMMLVSPSLVPAINTVQATFWAKRSKYGGEKGLIVGTITDPTDPTTFTPFDTVELTTEYKEYTVYFVNYTGTDMYLAWKDNVKDYPKDKIYLDDISIEEMASCIVPVNIKVLSTQQTSVDLYWEDLNGATTWEILVGEHDFVPGTDPANSYYYNDAASNGSVETEIKGLDTDHLYDVYIRTICSSTDQSEWEGPLTFYTAKPVAALPALEDFENGMGMARNAYDNTKDWELDTNLYVSGNHSIHNAYGAANNNALIIGNYDLSGKTNAVLSFYHIAKLDGNYDHGYVEISVDGGYTFEPLPESCYLGKGNYRIDKVYNNPEGPVFDEDSYSDWGTGYQTPTNDWWKKEYFDLSDYAGNSNVAIRFRVVSNKWTNKKGWYIDDVKVEAINAPVVTATPTAINETVMEDATADVALTLSNAGGFPAKYKVKVVYDEQDLINENFDNGIPDTWTSLAMGTTDTTWIGQYAYQTYYSFNGTQFAMCSGKKPAEIVDLVTDGVLLTPVVDASSYKGKGLLLEFDQAFADYYTPGDTARVYVYDGTQWVMIYEHYQGNDGRLSYNSNGVHKTYDVSEYANANFQVKFRYTVGSGKKGYYFAIENVRLRASEHPLGWLTVDDSECVKGILYPDVDNNPSSFNVKLNPAGLAYETYQAEVMIESTDPSNPTITIPVSMTVQGVPYNVNLLFNSEQGNPLENVFVVVGDAEGNNDTVQTGADGVATFAGLVSGEYTYCAKKSGYGKVTGNFMVDHADYNDTIVMLDAYKLMFWFTHEGVALEGVDVTVNNQTLVTDMDGFVMFEDLVPGDYDYVASKEGYMTVTGTVPIIAGNVNVIVEMPSEPHNITFVCTLDGAPVQDAAVTLDGVTMMTDAAGQVVFVDEFPGVYSYTVEKDGFVPVYGTVEVTDADVTVDVPMELITYSVSFYCKEEGTPVEGVTITMNGTSVVSDTNGLAFFNELIPGNYIFSVTKDGYFTMLGTVDVVDMDVDVDVNMKSIVYTMTFNVNDGYNPVEGAVVEMDGRTSITDADGVATFTDVVPGVYPYQVSVDGYVAYEDVVEAPDLVSEQGFNENISVDVSMSITGIVNGENVDVAIYPVPAKDVVNIDHAANATMTLVDLSGKAVFTKEINTNHETINVSSLPAGIYFIYLNNSDNITTHKIVVTK